jgi:NTE family protein
VAFCAIGLELLMNRKVLVAVLLALFAVRMSLCAQTARSDSEAGKARGRVGVALSGGGALGLAHIGVLQYFEEHRIPIDALAGTSMGGLVGGLFATGLNSGELTDIAEHSDWDLLLSPTPQYRDQPIIEKQSWNRSYGNLTLRLGRRFSLPQGINSGEALAMMLSRNTIGYGDLSTFDDLPTPFRCVATDLISADRVVLDRGSLAKAMRATMALPAVFTPVRLDDKVLVDGGIVLNLPVEVVQSMGVDKTIGVILQGTTPTPKDLNSLSSIALRSVSVAVEQNERISASKADVVITVDTRKYTGTDYARSHDLIRAGYMAAKAQEALLKQFEVSEDEWEAYQLRRKQRSQHAPEEGPVVAVHAQQPTFRENATVELQRKLGPNSVSPELLEDTLSGIVAATGVPGASYTWSNERHGYSVEFLERPGESILVRPSFIFSTSPGEPSQAALRVSLSHIGATAYKSRTIATATIGYDPGIRTEYYHPIGGTGYFVAPGFIVERTHTNAYAGAFRSSQTRDRFAGTFFGGLGTWRYVQLRFGVTGGFDSYGHDTVTDGVTARSHAFANPEVRWIYNTLDSGGLPYHGTRVEGAYGYSIQDNSHLYLSNDFTHFGEISRHVSWVVMQQFATSFGKKLNSYEQFTAGGAGLLAAYRYQEFHANTLGTAGGGLVFHAPPVRRLSVYPGFALLYEVGRFDIGSQGWATHQSATTGLFFPTPIGAAGISVSFTEEGKARFRLSLGALGSR